MKNYAHEVLRLKNLIEIEKNSPPNYEDSLMVPAFNKIFNKKFRDEELESAFQKRDQLKSIIEILNDRITELNVMKDLEEERNKEKSIEFERAKTVMKVKENEIKSIQNEIQKVVSDINLINNDPESDTKIKRKIQKL